MKVAWLLLVPTQPWKYFSCALEVSESIVFIRKTTMKRESLKKAVMWVLLSTGWLVCNLDGQPPCNWKIIVSINPFIIIRSLYVKSWNTARKNCKSYFWLVFIFYFVYTSRNHNTGSSQHFHLWDEKLLNTRFLCYFASLNSSEIRARRGREGKSR